MPKYKTLTSEHFRLMRYNALFIGTYTSIDTDSYSTFCSAAMIYRVYQEERSVFWEVIVSVILSKNVYMNMCPIPNGFWDRAIWMYNRKIVDKKGILRVRTVSNTGIYCSSDRVGTVYNKCSKIPPSTSVHFATRVKTWRVVRLSASWRSFMQAITSGMLTSSSSRVSTSFLYNSSHLYLPSLMQSWRLGAPEIWVASRNLMYSAEFCVHIYARNYKTLQGLPKSIFMSHRYS